MSQDFDRRSFVAGVLGTGLVAGAGVLLSGCDNQTQGESGLANSGTTGDVSDGATALTPLPPSSPDPDSEFGVDLNINIETIDDYLGRDDVAYRDMRMLFDPADFEAIGGSSDLPDALEGFRIIPYPHLATLPDLPVEGAYTGETVFSLTFDDEGSISSATENYLESKLLLEDLFPKDKNIFLVCGGAGYAAMTKALLIHLGWDADKLYNVGGMWGYTGKRIEELIVYATTPGGTNVYATWRADYAFIDFSRLHEAV